MREAPGRVGSHGGTARPGTRAARQLLWAQGAYYAVAGAWPIMHARSFEAVTGPKPDRFVLESTGALFAAAGLALVAAASRDGAPDGSARLLSALVPAASTLAVLRHRPEIRPVYVADAVVQCAFGTAVAIAGWRGRR